MCIHSKWAVVPKENSIRWKKNPNPLKKIARNNPFGPFYHFLAIFSLLKWFNLAMGYFQQLPLGAILYSRCIYFNVYFPSWRFFKSSQCICCREIAFLFRVSYKFTIFYRIWPVFSIQAMQICYPFLCNIWVTFSIKASWGHTKCLHQLPMMFLKSLRSVVRIPRLILLM